MNEAGREDISAVSMIPVILQNHLTTGVLLLDQSLSVAWVNDPVLQIFGTTKSQVIGKSFDAWVINSSENHYLEALKACLNFGHPFTIRELKVGRNGSAATVDASFSQIPDFQPNPAGTGIRPSLMVEISQVDNLLKIARDSKYATDENNLKKMLKGLAHEVKNPLGGIKGAAQLMAKEADASIFQEYLQVIISEANRLTNLVDRLIGPHHQEKFQTTNIHQILEHCRALISAEFEGGGYIDRDYDPSLPEIQADEEQLTQAIINISRNAAQALSESHTRNPEISFTTRAIRKHDPETGVVSAAIRLRIQDNGPGIPEDLKDRIFLPMVSGRAQGSGIGLAITQTIISRHHGWIEVESEPGHTSIDVILPFGDMP